MVHKWLERIALTFGLVILSMIAVAMGTTLWILVAVLR